MGTYLLPLPELWARPADLKNELTAKLIIARCREILEIAREMRLNVPFGTFSLDLCLAVLNAFARLSGSFN
jgi:hypothetical protein